MHHPKTSRPRPRPARPAPAAGPPVERGSRLFTLALYAWFFGAYGLVVWGVVSDRGPCAFLLDWQRAAFGGSSLVLGALLGAVVVFWGPSLLGRIAGRLSPASPAVARYNQLMRLAMMSRSEAAARARMVWNGMDDGARRRMVTRRRNAALIVAAVLLVGTAAVNLYVTRSASADAGQPLRPVMLGGSAPLLPEGATPWVRVLGAHPVMEAAMQRDYSIRGTPYRDYYTPLVPEAWTPGSPIALLEKDETFPDLHRPQDIPDPPGAIEGVLSDGGPRPEVEAFFRRQGYAVDDRTLVLTRKPLHGVIPGEDPFLGGFIWYMGGMLTLMALLVAGLTERQRRRI
ncbi:hypothetical protein [Acidisoma sp. 7E03]